MATQTGRTVGKYVTVKMEDAGTTLRTIVGTQSIGGVGITYNEVDVTALEDALTNYLNGHGDMSLSFTDNVDNTADTGFHVVFSALNGLQVPLSFDIQIGVRHAWESGEPQFGITGSATSGVIVTSYIVDPASMTATATVKTFGGTAPAWGTAAET